MTDRRSFSEIKTEQSRMTESWKAEGRLSEAWVIADPEIVEIFSAGVAAILPTRRTNGAEHSVRLWKKPLPSNPNLKRPNRGC
jgi:hypothetical protein